MEVGEGGGGCEGGGGGCEEGERGCKGGLRMWEEGERGCKGRGLRMGEWVGWRNGWERSRGKEREGGREDRGMGGGRRERVGGR